MQLISNVKDLLKMTSVQVAAATGVVAIAEQVLPQLQAVLPPVAYAVLSAVIIIARAIKQPGLSKT
ncbi:hypothetical protein D9M71_286230 [compost metagenome]